MSSNRPESGNSEYSVVAQKLALPASLEDGTAPVFSTYFSYVASILILALIIWGSFAEMREFASATGEIVPSGAIKRVHHLEGGQIKNILAKEGQLVKAGDPIVMLQPVIAESEYAQLDARREHLGLKLRKLTALINNEPFARDAADDAKLYAIEYEAYIGETRRLSRQQATMKARVAQKKIETQSLAHELKSIRRRQKIAVEKLNIQKSLIANGYTSRRAFLDAQEDVEELKTQEISTNGRLEATEEQIVEAQSAYEQARTEASAQYALDYSKLAGELLELEENIKKHRDRVDRLVIKSPTDGIVHQLGAHSIGEVAKPGDLIAAIVPVDDKVVAEVRINPRDIGHIKAGDAAELSISTFDTNIFGVVKGTLERVSPSNFRDDAKSQPYFKAFIRLDKANVGPNHHQVPILPGMIVDARIVTGSKSIMRYLLKPIYRSWNRSLSER